MKLLEFRKIMLLRWSILRANLGFAFRNDIAYAGNNWAALASTSFFTIGMLLFLDILFANIKELAGYNHQEMLFFFLTSQFTYYLTLAFTIRNFRNLIDDVNQGNLDMVLIKPVPALFYLSTRSINIFPVLTEGFPPTLVIALAIHWGELIINPVNVLIGIIILILGLWIINVFSLLSSLPVFWLGESTAILDLSLQMSSGNGVLIPLEGYGKNIQILLSTVIPVLLSTAFAASAILGKSDPVKLLVWVMVMAVVATILRVKMWNLAIKNYTSASS